MNKVAIIGANGQLGTDLVKVFQTDHNLIVFPLTHKDIEITDEKNIRSVLDEIDPTIVINTAAYHRVDECETNLEKAFLVNATAQKNLSQYCEETNRTVVYLSTDYAFGLDAKRKTPYIETDAPGPLNVYGLSKLTGEYFTRYIAKKHFVIRSCGLYGLTESTVKGGNFVNTMLKLAKEKKEVRVVNDQITTPTYTRYLASQIHKLITTDHFGLYHATAQGECSWYEFAKEIFRLTNTQVNLIPVTTEEYKTPAKRPRYSVLDNKALQKLGLDSMFYWQTELENYLSEKGYR